ncbi:unnamed protein product [Brassicogethes aeneus]|uniref:DUF4806 domain-containing protein n=1 Tax=Brassicogethes aeneus TaxID=1431903 RepID=A0A9P0BKP9_BRAAE|nr:unnamed protein product [Brassicogethes aeneus]
MWYVVLFTHENNVAVCPSSWHVESTNEFFWPPSSLSTAAITKCIKHTFSPQEDWLPYPGEILGKYVTYEIAMSKQLKAQTSDHLTTTEDDEAGRGKRKRKAKSYISDYVSNSTNSELSEDCGLTFPKVPTPMISVFPEKSQNEILSLTEERTKPVRKKNILKRMKSRSLSPNIHRHTNNISSLLKSFKTAAPKSQNCPNILMDSSSSATPKSQHRPNMSPLLDSAVLTRSDESIIELLNQIKTENAEFRINVNRRLNIINMKVNDIYENLESQKSLNGDTHDFNMNTEVSEILGNFPLKNENDLLKLEKLLQDDGNKKFLVVELARTGGSEVKEIVKRIMYKVFTNEVGEKYSWEGAKQKQKFKDLKIARVIMDAVRYNKNTQNSTEAEIIFCIKKWLVKAPDRKKKAITKKSETQSTT